MIGIDSKRNTTEEYKKCIVDINKQKLNTDVFPTGNGMESNVNTRITKIKLKKQEIRTKLC